MTFKSYLKPTLFLCAAVSLLIMPELAQAADEGIAGMTAGLNAQISSITTVIKTVAYVAALGFVFAGIVKFKAHKDQPTQVPLSAPITLIVVGAALAYAPGLLRVGGESLGFQESDSANISSGSSTGSSGAGK